MTNQKFHAGFVAVLGKPNVGKSTVVNYFLGQPLCAVTAKPQTTRQTIRGILTTATFQMVFVDTPGIHQANSRLGEQMNRNSLQAQEAADILLVVVDAASGFDHSDGDVCARLRRSGSAVATVVLVNKIDAVGVSRAEALCHDMRRRLPGSVCLAGSARSGTGMAAVLQALVAVLPPGGLLFPAEQLTDRPERFFVQEIVREQALLLCHDEVPHSVAVLVDEFREQPGRKTLIRATIYVERASQKAIVIGRDGQMLKAIGTAARHSIAALIGQDVYLELWVKVRHNWRKDAQFVKQTAQDI